MKKKNPKQDYTYQNKPTTCKNFFLHKNRRTLSDSNLQCILIKKTASLPLWSNLGNIIFLREYEKYQFYGKVYYGYLVWNYSTCTFTIDINKSSKNVFIDEKEKWRFGFLKITYD